MTVWHVPQPQIGQRATRENLVLKEHVELFARITGDFNPLHFDEQAARRSTFGEMIVHGGITSGILNALIAQDLPGPGSVFLHVDWSFKAPVRPGDRIIGEVEVIEVRGDKPITRLRTSVVRSDGVVVLEGTALTYTTET